MTTSFTERDAILMAMEEYKLQTRMDHDLYMESKRMRDAQYNTLLQRLRELDERDHYGFDNRKPVNELREGEQLSQQVYAPLSQRVNNEKFKNEKEETLREILGETRFKKMSSKYTMQELLDLASEVEEFKPSKEQLSLSEEEKATNLDKSLASLKDGTIFTQTPDSLTEPESQKTKNVKENIRMDKLKYNRKPAEKQIPFERVASTITEFMITNKGNHKVNAIKKYTEEKLDSTWKNFSNVFKKAMEINPKIIKVSHGLYKYEESKPKE